MQTLDTDLIREWMMMELNNYTKKKATRRDIVLGILCLAVF